MQGLLDSTGRQKPSEGLKPGCCGFDLVSPENWNLDANYLSLHKAIAMISRKIEKPSPELLATPAVCHGILGVLVRATW